MSEVVMIVGALALLGAFAVDRMRGSGSLSGSNYYTFVPGEMTLKGVLERWVKNGEKVYESVYLLPTREVVPHREYRWSRTHHRGGAVPLPPQSGQRGFKYAFMAGMHHGRKETVDPGYLRILEERGDRFIEGNRWEYLTLFMKQYGWKDDPAHLHFGKNNLIKLGEGNHRVGVAHELGIDRVPVMFHFVNEVRFNRNY